MTFLDSLSRLQTEGDSLSGTNKTKLQNAITMFNEGTGTTEDQVASVNDMIDVYNAETLLNDNMAIQAIMCIAQTVDPSKPSGFIKHA